jgi:hypothetical protein
MASTTRSSNGRSKQAATRSSAAPSRPATADRAARSRSRAARANESGSTSPRTGRGNGSGTSSARAGRGNGGGSSGSRSSRGNASASGGSPSSRANRGSSGSPRSRASRSSDRLQRRIGAATRTIGSAAKKAKIPLVASGAAVAGLATGTALGARVVATRRPRVLGMPMPRGEEMKSGAHKVARAGRWLYDMETDLRLLREHAENSRRQSPIEVLLAGLTSRSLPRRG